MDNLASYGSDDDCDESPKLEKSEFSAKSYAGKNSKAFDANYDEVGMDLSEDSSDDSTSRSKSSERKRDRSPKIEKKSRDEERNVKYEDSRSRHKHRDDDEKSRHRDRDDEDRYKEKSRSRSSREEDVKYSQKRRNDDDKLKGDDAKHRYKNRDDDPKYSSKDKGRSRNRDDDDYKNKYKDRDDDDKHKYKDRGDDNSYSSSRNKDDERRNKNDDRSRNKDDERNRSKNDDRRTYKDDDDRKYKDRDDERSSKYNDERKKSSRDDDDRSKRYDDGYDFKRYRSSSRDRNRSRSPIRGAKSSYKSSETWLCKKKYGYSRRYDKASNKMAHLEKMGIEIKTPDGQYQDKRDDQKSGNAENRFFLPGVSGRLREQMERRKMLWHKKEPEQPVVAQPEVAACSSKSGKVWEATTFAQDQDGKLASKFKRLMGIRQASSDGTKLVPDMVKKQEELFSTMEQQYEVARTATHTMRGVGLGFGSYQ